MAKVDKLELGAEATQLVKDIAAYESDLKFYGSEGLDHKKQELFAKFDLLAKSAPQDFTGLLAAEDLLKSGAEVRVLVDDYYSEKFFLEYINGELHRANVFVKNCTYNQMLVYANRMRSYLTDYHKNWINDFQRYGEQLNITLYRVTDSITRLKLEDTQADTLRIILIKMYASVSETLDGARYRVTDPTNIKVADNCVSTIILLVNSLTDVNHADLTVNNDAILLKIVFDISKHKSEHQAAAKDLAYDLIRRGVKIISTYGKRLSLPLNLKLCDDQQTTQDFFTYVLESRSAELADKQELLKKTMREAITGGNQAAIRALFPTIITADTKDKLQFCQLLAEVRNIRYCEKTVSGILVYLQLIKASVNDMLEYLAKQSAHGVFIAVKALLSDCAYHDYEKGSAENVLYYLAYHPEMCATILQDRSYENVPDYIHNRYNQKEKHRGYIPNGHLVSDIFVKDEVQLSPLHIAVSKENVQFLLLTVNAILSGAKTSEELKRNFSSCVLYLMTQKVDLSPLTATLENKIFYDYYTTPRFSSKRYLPNFEYTLFKKINAKSEELNSSGKSRTLSLGLKA